MPEFTDGQHELSANSGIPNEKPLQTEQTEGTRWVL